MKRENELKPPKVKEYFCPICSEQMKVSFGSPVELICHECKNKILQEHEADELKNCPFCNADRKQLKYSLSVPYYYGACGVRVLCSNCHTASGYGSIYHYENNDCTKPPLFNYETITNGFVKARAKWNRRAKP